MSAKVKDKKKKKHKKEIAGLVLLVQQMDGCNTKSKCCKKYKKGENKRCSRCPMFDLL